MMSQRQGSLLPPAEAKAERAALEQAWLALTRDALPAMAASRRWPVRFDHCFQRILLDDAFQGRWYDHVEGRPAYRHVPDDRLAHAVLRGRQVLAGELDLHEMNRASLRWRGKEGPKGV